MLQTAEYVAKRYNISREAQDRYGVAAASSAPPPRGRGQVQRRDRADHDHDEGRRQGHRRRDARRKSRAEHDEGIRADTTYEGVSQIKPAIEGGVIAAGNASQFSDGASAQVVMSDKVGGARGPQAAGHLPRLRGGRLRAGRDGHRPGVRGAEAARSAPA